MASVLVNVDLPETDAVRVLHRALVSAAENGEVKNWHIASGPRTAVWETFEDYAKGGWVVFALPPDIAEGFVGAPATQLAAHDLAMRIEQATSVKVRPPSLRRRLADWLRRKR